ncbi:hypothetical protein [Methanosarcina sp. 1.H.A.2.2]|nr:hypothetical protein [Methanosarcina sp. 1.H.A.2.2]
MSYEEITEKIMLIVIGKIIGKLIEKVFKPEKNEDRVRQQT